MVYIFITFLDRALHRDRLMMLEFSVWNVCLRYIASCDVTSVGDKRTINGVCHFACQHLKVTVTFQQKKSVHYAGSTRAYSSRLRIQASASVQAYTENALWHTKIDSCRVSCKKD